jgi:hypothetical protein
LARRLFSARYNTPPIAPRNARNATIQPMTSSSPPPPDPPLDVGVEVTATVGESAGLIAKGSLR